MQEIILHYGPPPLTEQAADAALDAIDFIAAAVRGYHAIDVTDVVRPLWRTQLVTWYPYLPLVTRQWYADAPLILATLQAQWSLLDPMQRDMVLRQWSLDLPHMLMMLDPVLAEAHAIETQENVRAGIPAARERTRQARPASADSETRAMNALSKNWDMAESLRQHNVRMAGLTSGLLRAMSHR